MDAIQALFTPSSVAIVGATPRGDYGGRFLTAALRAQDRVRVYPVNPRYEELQGVPCFPSVSTLPETPDLVGIAVPSAIVLDVLEESYSRGTQAAVIVSANFAERGEDRGTELQEAVAAFARRTGMRIVGPNCLGVADVLNGVYSCALGVDARPGSIAVICQSGATAFGTLVPRARDLGLGLRCVVSTGNEVDLEVGDFVEHFADDPDTKVIAAFVEGFKNPRRFLAAARRAAEVDKPIVLVKIGRAEAGSRAARSHTASLTGDDEVSNAMFTQYGVTRVDDFEQLLEVARMFAGGRRPARPTVAVGSHSGGLCSLMADLLGVSGFVLPPLTEPARATLADLLAGRGWAANPVDMSGIGDGDRFEAMLRTLNGEPETESIVLAGGSAEALGPMLRQRAETAKETLLLWTQSRTSPALTEVLATDLPVFFSPAALVRGLDALVAYGQWRQRFLDGEVCRNDQTASVALPEWATARAGRSLCEHESTRLAREWGVPTARSELVHSADAAVAAAEAIGYPVVVKADGPALLHKSDVGGVLLGVRDADAVRSAYASVFAAGWAAPGDEEPHGVLVCETVDDAVEVIVGVRRDPQIGPVVLFGIGGTGVEVYRDVVRRLCPVTTHEAREMVGSVTGAPLLTGARGRPPADIGALVRLIVDVSEVAAGLGDQLEELDLNPVMVRANGGGVVAVDALAILGSP